MRSLALALLAVAAGCGTEIQVYDSAGNAIAPPTSIELPALTGFGKARPVDQAPQDPSLVAFRDTLLAIVQRKDSAALHARFSPTVKYSFGESQGGPSGLFAHWREHHSMPTLWATLDDVLAHGGVFDGGGFYAPWTFRALPDSLDAFEHLVIRDSNVVMRSKPDFSDPGFGTLSYDIVRSGPYRADSVWREIGLPDGRSGYVPVKHVRSPVDWRIGMRKSNGRWMIDFFVAGD
jgi:hypothetical protein